MQINGLEDLISDIANILAANLNDPSAPPLMLTLYDANGEPLKQVSIS
jgi:hypothetical protein